MSFIAVIAFVLIVVWKIWMSSPKNIGKYGERRVARKLDWLPAEYVALNDLLLPTRYGTTQIDHIVVSPYGIFVIETKNYKGWIFGHENSEQWKQSLLGKKTVWGWLSEQHHFRNPIKQNMSHARAVKSLLSDIGDFTIYPMVVFSDRADLNITTPNHCVINWSNLRQTIKSIKTVCISQENIQKIVARLTTANNIQPEARENHIRNVQTTQMNVVSAIANRTCPKCGRALVQRSGKYGEFLGCSNYPKCTFTHKI